MVHNVYMFNLVFFISQNKSKENQNVSYSVDMSQIHCALLDMYPHSFVENSFEMTSMVPFCRSWCQGSKRLWSADSRSRYIFRPSR